MLPRHIKSIEERDGGVDTEGTPYAYVTVQFKWWYRPIAWLNMLRSRPFPYDER